MAQCPRRNGVFVRLRRRRLRPAYGFDSGGEQLWEAGLALSAGDYPILQQGNGVWLMDGGGYPRVETTDKTNRATATWTYDLHDDAEDIAFAASGNRVFVASGSTLYALPVF